LKNFQTFRTEPNKHHYNLSSNVSFQFAYIE